MDIQIDGQHVTVTLSRKNLKRLLEALDIHGGKAGLDRRCENGLCLSVRAQDDDPHYIARRLIHGKPLD